MTEMLRKYAEENKTILCFGIDPVLERIKTEEDEGSIEERIMSYYFKIIDKLLEEKQIAAIKPNYAYFAQYGLPGLSALGNIINRYKGKTFVILDVKRGDIGKSSEAYAKEAYDFWGVDAVTVSPYMGSDSVKPFIQEGKTVYVLCRTSNEGAKDFQELKVGDSPLYEKVAEKAMSWGCGLVVGATSDSIKEIVRITDGMVPLLIPGIGAQGGNLNMVMESIKEKPYIHRINASSSIAYAYEKTSGGPTEAALEEAKKLNEKIREFLK